MTFTTAPTRPAPANRRRDLGIDAYRAFAMFVVVAWHWVFTIATWGPRGPRVDNPISFVPELAPLTWVLQVMPLFFLVGGHVTAASLRDVPPDRVGAWALHRLRRLATPAAPLLGALVLAYGVARLAGEATVARAVLLTATPLWFLGVYVAIAALAPPVQRVARRWPLGHVVGLVVWCVLWDAARFTGLVEGGWTWLSMLVVWLAVHQAGGLLDRVTRRGAVALVGGGACSLVAATTWGPYPASMVGTTTDRISNMSPPTAVLLALAAVQLGLVVLTRPAVTRLAQRHAGRVAAAARCAMPVYLWHMVGFAACVVVAHRAGLPLPAEPTLGWWLARPLWVLGPAAVAAPLVRRSVATHAPSRHVDPLGSA